jgi:hypothetical protein
MRLISSNSIRPALHWRREAVRSKILANGRPRIEKTKECYFTPEIFSPRDKKKRK